VSAKTAKVKTVKTASAMNKKRLSLGNLIAGYLLAIAFIALIPINQKDEVLHEVDYELVKAEENNTIEAQEPIVYNPPSVFRTQESVYIDRLQGTIRKNDINKDIAVFDGVKYIGENVETVVVDGDEEFIGHNPSIGYTSGIGGRVHSDNLVGGVRHGHGVRDRVDQDIDYGLLDRRVGELDDDEIIINKDFKRNSKNREPQIGLNKKDDSLDLSKLTVSRDNDKSELGDVNLDSDFSKDGEGYGVGKGGQLYAYNFPTRGVGAGVGSAAVGAGSGAGAGLGAGIGEGMLNGEAVPTLGGIGDGSGPEGAPSAGVGGLVGGAGAGGAAGLTQGYITEKLGLGIGAGEGMGYGTGGKGRYSYDHLPKDGSLHIMMHVDGSGSILNTRKQLDIMKDTILKTALLPYYNNDENLYNKRVTIVSSSGERTLRFFTEAAKKDNVLAIAFQDEAQPAYHLPNFNKKPEDHYLDDIGKLKSSLNGYNGVYRGVMFQVDRGKTFAKSFKEFVGNAFQGKGYLESSNLKKYYRDNNFNHIKNKDGIVFSDEYHAKDSGDPKYYLDLIFEASKKIGLDLDIYGGGLKDGKYNEQ